MAIRFMDEEHENRYYDILERMGKNDVYRRSVAYLLALDSECYKHIDSLFDFEDNAIKPEGALEKGWHTSTSVRTTRLMFNLWNGICADQDSKGKNEKDSEEFYSVEQIFRSCLGFWYFEAIKLRYPQLDEEVE